jgi:ParB/RepB/Spo0J family partition protein
MPRPSRDPLAPLVVMTATNIIDRAPTNRPCVLDDGFIASIREHGVLQPVLLHRRPDSIRLQLIAGERRWTAACQVGRDVIPAVIYQDLDPKTIAIMRAVENLRRRDLTPGEQAVAIQDVITAGMTRKDLAAELGETPAWVTQRVEYFTLDAAEQAAVDAGTIPWAHVPAVAKLDAAALTQFRARGTWQSVDSWLADHRRKETEHQAEIAARKQAAASGHPIVPMPRPGLEPGVVLEHVLDDDELAVFAEAHAGEPCHAITVTPRWVDNARTWATLDVCTDRTRHQPDGPSTLKWPDDPTGPDGPGDAPARPNLFGEHRAARQARSVSIAQSTTELLFTDKPNTQDIARTLMAMLRMLAGDDGPEDGTAGYELAMALGEAAIALGIEPADKTVSIEWWIATAAVRPLTATEQIRTMCNLVTLASALAGEPATIARLTARGWTDPDPAACLPLNEWAATRGTTEEAAG